MKKKEKRKKYIYKVPCLFMYHNTNIKSFSRYDAKNT